MSMFNEMNLFGSAGVEGVGDIQGRLVLVEVIAALTDYTHTPHNRAPMPYLPSNMMDELVLTNRQGLLTENEMKNYSAHMGRLNNMPGDISKIRGGYTESNKGLMKLKFRIQNGGMNDEYISVLGYITENDVEGSISENAIFIPAFSWKHSAMMDNHVGNDGLSFTVEQMGRRTDYLINDGSSEPLFASIISNFILGAVPSWSNADTYSVKLICLLFSAVSNACSLAY